MVWYGMVWYGIQLYCIVLYCIVLYCIARRIDLNLSKSTQSAAEGVKALKPAANGRYVMCKNHYPAISIYCTEVQS